MAGWLYAVAFPHEALSANDLCISAPILQHCGTYQSAACNCRKLQADQGASSSKLIAFQGQLMFLAVGIESCVMKTLGVNLNKVFRNLSLSALLRNNIKLCWLIISLICLKSTGLPVMGGNPDYIIQPDTVQSTRLPCWGTQWSSVQPPKCLWEGRLLYRQICYCILRSWILSKIFPDIYACERKLYMLIKCKSCQQMEKWALYC